MKKAGLLMKERRGRRERGQREPCRPSLIRNDDVHFQRFRYPTKEEGPSGGTKVLAFMEVEFPDRSTQRLYSFLARFEIGNLQHGS